MIPIDSPTKSSKATAQDFRLKVEKAKHASRISMDFFIQRVFSHSFENFINGNYLTEVAKHLEANNYTIDVTGRDHFKSTRLYADIMWAIFTNEGNGFEAHYFSYKSDLAGYHIRKCKAMIAANPYFAGLIDNKPTAETLIDFSWDKKTTHMTVNPGGLLAFKRGIHADRVYVDDPLRDPENKLQPLVIYKINSTIKRELLPMVNKGGICRIVGTPQTKEDFFFDPIMQRRFTTWITAAEVDKPNKIALWPEWKSWEELQLEKDTMGESLFNQEYNANPVYSEDSFLNKDLLMELTDIEAMTWAYHDSLDNVEVVAGFDIGKKAHPSHLAVFSRTERENEKGESVYYYEQIFSKWMDNWDYEDQITFIKEAIENFNIQRLYYDNTRGEFESINEQGRLPKEMQPFVFGARSKQGLATNFLTAVETRRIRFINEDRQTNQLLSVTSSLDAIAGPEGHGDAFWSCCLALNEPERKKLRIRSLND